MTLFKYIRPERIDVIEKCEIRFTQPDALNDPFELQPRFESILSEADVLANLPAAPVDLEPVVEEVYAMLSEAQKAQLPLDAAMRAVEAFMETDEARVETSKMLRMFLESLEDSAEPIREAVYRVFSDNVGILSLSEIPDHELMWAHYADSHKGLVLGFDEQHAFFNRRRSENDEFYHVRRVLYSDSPARSMGSLDGDALLVTKGTQWAYEKEWRMLVPLKDATRSIETDRDTVNLYAFPSEALESIVVGANASVAMWDFLQDLLKNRADLGHIRLSRAMLDLHTRSVRVSLPEATTHS